MRFDESTSGLDHPTLSRRKGSESGESTLDKAKTIMVAGAATLLGVVSLCSTLEAKVLTMKECKAQYHTAKDAGDLIGTTWTEFRRAHVCTTKDQQRKSK
jgi:hypothetical protein